MRSLSVAVAVGALGLAAAWPVTASPFRSALGAVVKACSANFALTGSASPCLKVVRSPAGGGDYALVREPDDRARTILTPLADSPGIEDPALSAADAPNWFSLAWNERGSVLPAGSRIDDWSGIGLAINSAQSRTQDQMHIHIACLNRDVRAALDRRIVAVNTRRMAMLNFKLGGRPYWGMRIDAGRLDAINPFQLVRHDVPGAAAAMDRVTIAVVGTRLPTGAPDS